MAEKNIIPLDCVEQQLELYMPLPGDLRALPWVALRSALFTTVKTGDRKLLTRKKVAVLGKHEIRYTGHQLDQTDLDVYEQVLFMARNRLDQPIKYQTKAFLDALGRDGGKSQRDWLYDTLSRLTACEVEIKNGNLAYAGSLIQEHGRDDLTGTHYIVINPRIAALYYNDETGGTFSVYKRDERRQLGKKSLAKWLFGFVAGNKVPFTMKISQFQELSGSTITLPRKFRQKMDEAADDVNAVFGDGRKLCLNWNLDNQTVTVEVKPPAKRLVQENP